MRDIKENIVVTKSKNFAIRCVRLYQHLTNEHGEYILSKQLIRSGTSIGANVKEGIRAQSRADFVAKMSISLKESSESEYWIELLRDTDYITEGEAESLLTDCRELIKIITSISVSTRKNQPMEG